MKKNLRRALVGVALSAVAAVPLLALNGSDVRAAGEDTVNVTVGDGEPGYSVNAFLPENLTVQTGTTVNWEFKWFEPHMVVLVNGDIDTSGAEPPADPSPFDFDGVRNYVYSGVLFGPDQHFAIKFQKAGDYHIECFIHPGMTGSVKVVDSGATDTQAAADARAAGEYTAAITTLKNLAAEDSAKPVPSTTRADGTKLFDATMDDARGGRDYIQQFFPVTLNIKTGDSVRWTNPTSNAHTVTFNPPPGPPEGDPFEIPPSKPAAAFDGTGFWHSGVIGVNPDDPTTPTSFEMTFSKAGSFQYVCILHEDQGMVGTVNVEAQTAPPPATATPAATKTAAPAPPSTGSGTAGTNAGVNGWLLLAAVVLAISASGVAVTTVRRR